METFIKPAVKKVLKAPGHDLVSEMVDRYMDAGPFYHQVVQPPKVHDFTQALHDGESIVN